jgi:glycosyltransferase involved in cell wall biosynthesis
MSTRNPLVTIVMTAYNGEKYIGEQIDSILAQTYKHWELIICDDHSTDGTLSIAQEYENRFKNIVVIGNPMNVGVSKNTEIGLRAARGELIATSDVDDVWNSQKIELQVEYMNSHEDCLLVYHDLTVVDEDLSTTIEESFSKAKLYNWAVNTIQKKTARYAAAIFSGNIARLLDSIGGRKYR